MNLPSEEASNPSETRAVGSRPAPSTGEPQVGDVVDDFLLVDRLGQGAFATVFLAHQQSLHRTVALKVSTAKSAEAETLAQLDHPNIVRVYDQRAVPDRGLRLLYMEYVRGGTLEAVVEKVRATPADRRSGRLLLEVVDEALAARGEKPPLDSMLRARLEKATWPESVCLLGAQLATALDYAHGVRVLHRDVKPANVLLDGSGRAKLADFNISYAASLDVATPEESLGGSLPYMAPEQLKAVSPFHEETAADVTERSDIYGLALVLVEVLTGELPFEAPADGLGWKELFAHLIETREPGARPDACQAQGADIPGMLVETLCDALHPDPEQRPASGSELARRLEWCLDPDIRRVLSPSKVWWHRALTRFPLVGLILAGLVVNAVLSALNIAHNLTVVYGEQWQEEFRIPVMLVNGIAFPLGIGAFVMLGWRMRRVLRRRAAGLETTAEERSDARRQGLRLGDLMAGVILPLWILGGITFPVWRHMQQGAADQTAYFHFTLSNLGFGILAATVSFFLLAHGVTRVLLPRLVDPGDEDAPRVRQLRRLRRRLPWYFAACTAVPFLSVVLLATQSDQLQELGGAFLALGLLGAVAFAATLTWSTWIRRDVDALMRALGGRAR
ncbi:MAG: serine/threonine-protein kinase [Planctomycetota bacterium]|nr:serine/threonine-protein kinase [Planctomycetota bacterium]